MKPLDPLYNVFSQLCNYFEKIHEALAYVGYVDHYCGDRKCSLSIVVPHGTLRIYKITISYVVLKQCSELIVMIQKTVEREYSSMVYIITSVYQRELEEALRKITALIGEYLVAFNEIDTIFKLIGVFGIEFRKTINGKVIPIVYMLFNLDYRMLSIPIAALSPHHDVIVPPPPLQTLRPSTLLYIS